MFTWKLNFIFLFVLLPNVFSHQVRNLRQVTFGNNHVHRPVFSHDDQRILFTIKSSPSLWSVFDVSVDESFPIPRKLSSGLGNSFVLASLLDGDTIQATNIFHFPNLTTAFEMSMKKNYSKEKYDFEAVQTNKFGNFKKRFSNFSAPFSRFEFGFKNDFALGTDDSGILHVTNLKTGENKSISNGTVNGAVFHKTKALVFYSTKFSIQSVNFETMQTKQIFQGKGIVIRDVCDEGKKLFVNFFNKTNSEFYLATISVESGKLESITLAGNRIFGQKGTFVKMSNNGKQLAFTRKTGGIYQLFVVDWHCENDSKKWFSKNKKIVDHFRQKITNFYGEEKHLKNLRQLTFGGQNAEGYFAFDQNSIVFQAAGKEAYDTVCDQIYRLDFDPNNYELSKFIPRKLSTGLGSCTCSYFFPDDKTAIYASTFLSVDLNKINDATIGTCAEKKCQSKQAKTDPILKKLCNTSYTWDLHSSYEIFKIDENGHFLERLTDSPGYDAEGAISPNGKLMVFTSVRSGDPELWLYNFEMKKFTQLTDELGYDGGPFFSPDGTKIGFRASRPKTEAEITKYKQLLSYDLVEPLAMELFTINVNGTGLRQIAKLGNSNWAPFYLNDNRRIIFSSNYAAKTFGTFDLNVINDDGTGLEQITFSNGFDAFPMMSRDGRLLIWGSSRNGKSRQDLNLFIADWID